MSFAATLARGLRTCTRCHHEHYKADPAVIKTSELDRLIVDAREQEARGFCGCAPCGCSEALRADRQWLDEQIERLAALMAPPEPVPEPEPAPDESWAILEADPGILEPTPNDEPLPDEPPPSDDPEDEPELPEERFELGPVLELSPEGFPRLRDPTIVQKDPGPRWLQVGSRPV